jgi:hypothetical protein
VGLHLGAERQSGVAPLGDHSDVLEPRVPDLPDIDVLFEGPRDAGSPGVRVVPDIFEESRKE